jgi:hypothetical protein
VERVSGIGGFFFRAKDPEALAKWYASNLGIEGITEESVPAASGGLLIPRATGSSCGSRRTT